MPEQLPELVHLEGRVTGPMPGDQQHFGYRVQDIPTAILELLKSEIERELQRRRDLQRIALNPLFRVE